MKYLPTAWAAILGTIVAPPLVAQTAAAPPASLARALDGAIGRSLARVGSKIDIWVDHSTWENAWVVATDHFEIRTTHSYGFGRFLTDQLENNLLLMQGWLGTDYAPAEPIAVHVFPDVAAYNVFGEANGAEHSSFYGSFWANAHADRIVAAVYSDNRTQVGHYVTHGVVHRYLAEAFPGRTHPTWIDEGLAAWFSLFFWSTPSYQYAVGQWESARRRPIPLDQLLQAPIGAYTSETNKRFVELAALFDYLFRFKEETRTKGPEEAPFRDYLLSVLQGDPDTSSPVHALVDDLESLQQELVAFPFPR